MKFHQHRPLEANVPTHCLKVILIITNNILYGTLFHIPACNINALPNVEPGSHISRGAIPTTILPGTSVRYMCEMSGLHFEGSKKTVMDVVCSTDETWKPVSVASCVETCKNTFYKIWYCLRCTLFISLTYLQLLKHQKKYWSVLHQSYLTLLNQEIIILSLLHQI